MDPIFPQHALTRPPARLPTTTPPVSAVPALCQQDRIARLAALAPEDAAAGLLWLAMNFPAVTDAMLDKLEFDAIDDPDSGREPERCQAAGTRPMIQPNSEVIRTPSPSVHSGRIASRTASANRS